MQLLFFTKSNIIIIITITFTNSISMMTKPCQGLPKVLWELHLAGVPILFSHPLKIPIQQEQCNVDQKVNGYIVSTQVARTFRPAHSSVHDAELEILGFLAGHAGNCTAAHTNGNRHPRSTKMSLCPLPPNFSQKCPPEKRVIATKIDLRQNYVN